ncbi:ATP-binding protein [Streptomyces sanyensis]|uniref:ATP-binding protein n=1 Tax=Streptomyces sanyensis TaxID=568869 RepID=UPI003D777BA4
MLRADAEHQVAGALARLRDSGAPRSAEDAEEVAAGEEGLSVWERNRFATVPSAARYAEAEAAGADGEALAALRAEAERELHEQDPGELVPDGSAPGTELAPLLSALEAQCRARYPGIRMDVRCPPALRAGVPGPVLRAVLFEVLDNAARAAAAVEGGLVQVLATSESPEALVEVQDSGSGLPAASRGRRVFALSAAGRQEGRSGGLHRARRFLRAFATPSVEAELEVFPSSHPTLTGAALRLVLPEQPGGA